MHTSGFTLPAPCLTWPPSDYWKDQLKGNKGVSFTATPSNGYLPGNGVTIITVHANSDMWGSYSDVIVSQVGVTFLIFQMFLASSFRQTQTFKIIFSEFKNFHFLIAFVLIVTMISDIGGWARASVNPYKDGGYRFPPLLQTLQQHQAHCTIRWV